MSDPNSSPVLIPRTGRYAVTNSVPPITNKYVFNYQQREIHPYQNRSSCLSYHHHSIINKANRPSIRRRSQAGLRIRPRNPVVRPADHHSHTTHANAAAVLPPRETPVEDSAATLPEPSSVIYQRRVEEDLTHEEVRVAEVVPVPLGTSARDSAGDSEPVVPAVLAEVEEIPELPVTQSSDEELEVAPVEVDPVETDEITPVDTPPVYYIEQQSSEEASHHSVSSEAESADWQIDSPRYEANRFNLDIPTVHSSLSSSSFSSGVPDDPPLFPTHESSSARQRLYIPRTFSIEQALTGEFVATVECPADIALDVVSRHYPQAIEQSIDDVVVTSTAHGFTVTSLHEGNTLLAALQLRLKIMMLSIMNMSYVRRNNQAPDLTGVPFETALEIKGEPTCGICLCEIELGQLVRRTPCLHVFHLDCISGWTAVRRVCPIDKYFLD